MCHLDRDSAGGLHLNVSTSYTGADENTVMKSVIQPLEEAINGVNDMTYMTSKASSNGDVEINIYFKQGTDPDMATVNVQNRVTRAQALLPADVNKVGVKVEKRQNNILRIFAVRSADGKYDEDFVSNYIDINIRPKLMRVTGVGNVQSLGNTYALRIWLKPDVMAQYGLTPNDIFAAIGGQSFVAGVGSLGEQSENSYQYSMQYKGTLKTIEEFNNIVLRTSGGGMLHLSDVAEVKIGAMSYNFTSNIQDKPGALCMVFAAPGANATEVNASINKTFEEMKATMPAGDDFLFAAIHNVVETLVIAIILVVLVVFFFLQNFKATIIPSISIIVSLLGTFAVVSICGFSLNIRHQRCPRSYPPGHERGVGGCCVVYLSIYGSVHPRDLHARHLRHVLHAVWYHDCLVRRSVVHISPDAVSSPLRHHDARHGRQEGRQGSDLLYQESV